MALTPQQVAAYYLETVGRGTMSEAEFVRVAQENQVSNEQLMAARDILVPATTTVSLGEGSVSARPVDVVGSRIIGAGDSEYSEPIYSDTPEGFVRTTVSRIQGDTDISEQFDVDVRALRSAYQGLLGRDAEDAELRQAAQAIAQGATYEQLTGELRQSDEYLDRQLELELRRGADLDAVEEQRLLIQQQRLEAENQARIDALNAELLTLQESVTTDTERARSEIEALLAAEQESLRKLQEEFAAQQAAIQAQAEAAAAQAAQQQAELQRQIDETNRQAREAELAFQREREGMQREGAERAAAGRRAGRTATARPLMAGVDMTPMAASGALGGAGSLGGGGGTLGGATALGG